LEKPLGTGFWITEEPGPQSSLREIVEKVCYKANVDNPKLVIGRKDALPKFVKALGIQSNVCDTQRLRGAQAKI
jgi:hypothetical protein